MPRIEMTGLVCEQTQNLKGRIVSEKIKKSRKNHHLFHGAKYDGQLRRGEFHGKGVLRMANGRIYNGEFKRGIINGKGTLTFPNGRRDEGEWVRNHPVRKSIFLPDGTKYEGQFTDGKRIRGKGIMTIPDGNRYEGVWKKGQNKLRKILKLIPIAKYDYKPKLTSQFQSCPVCQGHGFGGGCYNCYGKGWLD